MWYNANDTKTELIALNTVSKNGSQNPHIIHVFDSWFHVNAEEHVMRTYVKMQLCKGTLKEYLDNMRNSGPSIKPLEIVEIMIHILSGLCVCHRKGICHRDLSLTNSISNLAVSS
jgi:serine/threonine protein kinase